MFLNILVDSETIWPNLELVALYGVLSPLDVYDVKLLEGNKIRVIRCASIAFDLKPPDVHPTFLFKSK